ncbi:phosphate transport system substrate-binding protein [Azospirillaceae bacterium]
MKLFWPIAAVTLSLIAPNSASAQSSRDQIRISGSSTVYPFSTLAAENFGRIGKFRTPIVESIGTGGGIKIFCSGVGPNFPDVANASRPITAAEQALCAQNGVTPITEVRFGYDGISIGVSAKTKPFPLTRRQIFQAIAAQVPVNGQVVPNPYVSWSDIDPSLPSYKISLYGPSPVHGTRDAFNELVMDNGCETFPEIKALPKDQQKKICHSFREDGGWTDVAEDYSLIVGKLTANPKATGVFTFSYIDQNRDKVVGLNIDGADPTFENIVSQKYPVSRPLFFYVKNAHLKMIPGIREFVTEFISEKAVGEDGYLTSKGLIPLPESELKSIRAQVLEKLK